MTVIWETTVCFWVGGSTYNLLAETSIVWIIRFLFYILLSPFGHMYMLLTMCWGNHFWCSTKSSGVEKFNESHSLKIYLYYLSFCLNLLGENRIVPGFNYLLFNIKLMNQIQKFQRCYWITCLYSKNLVLPMKCLIAFGIYPTKNYQSMLHRHF